MSIAEISGGMATTKLDREDAQKTDQERCAVVILGSKGLWDVVQILGLTDAAIKELTARGHADKLVAIGLVKPPPEPSEQPLPLDEKPKSRRAYGTAVCGPCQTVFMRMSSGHLYCSLRCQKRAKRDRQRRGI